MVDIVDIQISDLSRLLEARKMSLAVSSEARLGLADRGYDSHFGARPLRRVIQNELQNPLAEGILRGDICDGAKISVGVCDDKLTFSF